MTYKISGIEVRVGRRDGMGESVSTEMTPARKSQT